jgi:hypothetical protein
MEQVELPHELDGQGQINSCLDSKRQFAAKQSSPIASDPRYRAHLIPNRLLNRETDSARTRYLFGLSTTTAAAAAPSTSTTAAADV